MNNYYDAIRFPILTEKITKIQELSENKVGFIVHPKANKSEIKKAIEKIFNVKVDKVNIVNKHSKSKRYGRYIGEKSGFKKAYVTLESGQKINFLG